MSTAPKRHITPEEYLNLERKAEFRSQYFNGEMFAMAGASANHVQITANTSGTLHGLVKGRNCRVGAVDMRIHIPRTGLYTYPDVFVVCGKPEYSEVQKDILLNPNILFEVLSETIESFDRGNKFAQYETIDSLTDYLLVAQSECRVERFRKQPTGDWLLSVFKSLDESVRFPDLGIELPLSEIYYLVDLSEGLLTEK